LEDASVKKIEKNAIQFLPIIADEAFKRLIFGLKMSKERCDNKVF